MSDADTPTGPQGEDADAWARETEDQILSAAIPLAAAEGWTRRLARRAGAEAGLSPAETDLLLPNGPADLAALLSRRHDARAMTLLAGVDPASLKIRERIRAAVEARLAELGEAWADDGVGKKGKGRKRKNAPGGGASPAAKSPRAWSVCKRRKYHSARVVPKRTISSPTPCTSERTMKW